MGFLKKIIGFVILSLIIAYVIAGFYTYFTQTEQVYFPSDVDFDTCPNFIESKKVRYKGTRMYFNELSDKLIVYYHSNTGAACDQKLLKNLVDELGISYIFVEYAGFANDDRTPTKKLILEDVKNVIEFTKMLNYSELILLGYSLGTGPATYHSSIEHADKVILVAPYTSIRDIAQERKPYFPIALLLRENFDNIHNLKNYDNKIIIIHGNDDITIPITYGKELFGSIKNEQKQFVEVDSGHGDILENSDAINAIKRFILS